MSTKPAYSKQAIEDYVKLRTKNRAVCDFEHCVRVYKMARKLDSHCDDDIVHAAAFLHDLDLSDDHEIRSAELAERVLNRYMDPADIFRVKDAIRNHTALGNPKSTEAIVIHDADLLDYIGAIGFVRLSVAAVEWYEKKSATDILKYILSMRNLIAEKLILKQSRSIGADRLSAMDILLEDAKASQ